MNLVILTGRAGKDADMATFESGGKSTRVSLATTRRYKKKDSEEYEEETEWHYVICNWHLAEWASKIKKGMLVNVRGRNKSRNYTDKNGIERSVTEVIAEEISFYTTESNRGPSMADPGAPTSTTATPTAAPTSNINVPSDDDLPF